MKVVLRNVWLAVLIFGAVNTARGIGRAEPPPLKIDSPRPHQVVQRIGTAPGAGFADVVVRGLLPPQVDGSSFQFRVVRLNDAPGRSIDWAPLAITTKAEAFEATARLPAGGWYRLEIRGGAADGTALAAAVEPLGVGEIFLIAGQSYATNCNDERLQVQDPLGRVVALKLADLSWAVAHDPQPVADTSSSGSIWPPVGDALARELRVPIGLVNVAVGGTSSQQWMPGGELHARLVQAGQKVGRFRAVLWQQGESDVIAKTSTETYVANVRTIRDSAVQAWGFSPPWLLAKSTHHPTVYDDPAGEQRIRDGIDGLLKLPGFRAGPDTDTLRGENRGDAKSRRHFSAIGQRRAAELWLTVLRQNSLADPRGEGALRIGLAEELITPPIGFPMAGYYHERLADGQLDPLHAKAIVFRQGDVAAALVVCDLIGISTDLSRETRRKAAAETGIPAEHIVVAATHSHTAPDYGKELWLHLGGDRQEPERKTYIERLIAGPVAAIVKAGMAARPVALECGSASQTQPVSFNRRFVMRDGSVRTWQNLANPDVVRAAGPIDPQIGLLMIRDLEGQPRGVLSNFALHLDTVGGMKWSADYPHFVEQTLRKAWGENLMSVFGTGCCGDINHVDPSRTERNKPDFIGTSLGESIVRQVGILEPIERPTLVVQSRIVHLPLQDTTQAEVARSIELLQMARRQEKIEFFDHVTAYKSVILDHLRRKQPYANSAEQITWGLSRSLAGIGETLPVDVTVMAISPDVAIVCLPGEVFVELGLAIKQASPFRTTLIVELSNAVETIYIPHRAAYAGGGYEVANSALQGGAGEQLVEVAVALLRQAATSQRSD